jgi:hypothetical protein
MQIVGLYSTGCAWNNKKGLLENSNEILVSLLVFCSFLSLCCLFYLCLFVCLYRLAGRSVGCLLTCLIGRSVGRSVCWLVDWLVGLYVRPHLSHSSSNLPWFLKDKSSAVLQYAPI